MVFTIAQNWRSRSAEYAVHLKLFIFDTNLAFHTSGNITKKGLGLGKNINVEIGCQVLLGYNDWKNIYELLDASFTVDDDIYNKAKAYLLNNKLTTPTAPPLDLAPTLDKYFSKLSLPATESPETLYAFYKDPEQHLHALNNPSAFMHDLALYKIPTGLSQEDFFMVLKANFLSHPFIEEIIKVIKKDSPLRFGAINAWITHNCSDKPTPYRWELKFGTRCLYSWLDYFVKEITWDRPSHSMIIYWNKGKK